ncbi:FAD-binding oxidoreductase [Neorhizobium sp. BETTINA12A]|uniref:NAD(P)/FAD-dependent oxidoreductase n=1 Tax=Neorhizobium sp. BETTINA12A TaxID=2908924 RepID=UPI001FF2DB06|nr:FAD-dependent oxidoreductase [Neorhizobium sp. BETTINA12A]MCJ9751404.1 FAD-binding oxidoreductase [Neorhizobium sp. BETTINA12A]
MAQVYDVVLIGGGVTGLMAAHKLSDLGMSVALVEKHLVLASGPSTRNEGWLHRGTYHAASIKDRASAIQVASRCIYGHEQFKRFAPEAIEGRDIKPFALIRNAGAVDEVLSRWEEADVYHRHVSHAKAKALLPDTDLSEAAAIFEVADVSVNTRLLYRKLLSLARKAGCSFYLGCEVERFSGSQAVLRDSENSLIEIQAQKFIYSTGTGAKTLFNALHQIDLPIRYWKSHLVVTHRLAGPGIFFLDPHEAAMMHHGDVSIVGFNEDALLCAEPSYEVLPDRALNLRNGIKRLFPSWDGDGMDIACVKVDFVADIKAARSLNIAISEPIPGHVLVLPGKMTEAPFLTDALASYLHNHLDNPSIARRPCDEFTTAAPMQEVA